MKRLIETFDKLGVRYFTERENKKEVSVTVFDDTDTSIAKFVFQDTAVATFQRVMECNQY